MAQLSARLLLALVAVETVLQWSRLGAVEAARWPTSFTLWVLCLLFVVRQPSVWSGLLRLPTVLFVAFGVWAFASSRWSSVQPSSFALGFGLLAVLLFGAAYVDRFGWQSFSAVVATALASFIGLGWLYTLAATGSDSTADGNRLIGLSSNPTALGFTAAVMALLAFSGFRGRPTAIGAILAFAGVVIFLADARTATISLVVGVLVIVAAEARGLLRAFALSGIMMCAFTFLIVVLAGDTVSPSLARSDLQGELETLTGRTELWDLADGWYADQPVVGHGIQAATELYAGAQEDGRITWEARDAHNTVIHTLLELGLVGAVLLVGFTAAYVVRQFDLPDPRASAPVVAIHLVGITEALMHEATLAVLVLAGAGAGVGVRPRASAETLRVPTGAG
ncbi:MAG: O-antigen ligase family protein [Acidimicrobiales bacterium]